MMTVSQWFFKHFFYFDSPSHPVCSKKCVQERTKKTRRLFASYITVHARCLVPVRLNSLTVDAKTFKHKLLCQMYFNYLRLNSLSIQHQITHNRNHKVTNGINFASCRIFDFNKIIMILNALHFTQI